MYVKFLRGTVADGEKREKGSSADISDKDAKFLIARGAAVEAKKPKGKKAPVNRSIDESELESR